MAEDTDVDALSWSVLVDRLAGPLRLEAPEAQAYGLLAILHIVATLWGEIALLRAAERLVACHYFNLEGPLAAQRTPALERWFGLFLARHAAPTGPLGRVPLPPAALKPAWLS